MLSAQIVRSSKSGMPTHKSYHTRPEQILQHNDITPIHETIFHGTLDLLLPINRRRDTSSYIVFVFWWQIWSILDFRENSFEQTLFVTNTEDWNVIRRSTQSLNAFLQFLMQEDLDHFMEHKLEKITEKAFSTKKAQRLASTQYKLHSSYILYFIFSIHVAILKISTLKVCPTSRNQGKCTSHYTRIK